MTVTGIGDEQLELLAARAGADVLHRNPHCRQVFAIFAGLGVALRDDAPWRFMVKADLPDRNVLSFVDPRLAHFLNGASEDQASVDAFTDDVAALVEAFAPADELHIVAAGPTAFAVVLLGHRLRAASVHAFGSPSVLRNDDRSGHLARPLDGTVPGGYLDISTALQAGNGVTEYVFHLPGGWRARSDRQHLADVPQLTVRTHRVGNRALVPALQRADRFKALFPAYRSLG